MAQFKQAAIGSWFWDIRNNSIYWSDEVYEISGFAPRAVEPTVQFFLDHVHPADRDKVTTAFNMALQGKPYSVEHRFLCATGVQKWLYAYGRLIYDENNNLVRIYGIVQDITERKQAEQAMSNVDAALLKRLTANVLDIISQVDQQGVVQYVSPSSTSVLGYTPGELCGRSMFDYIHDDDLQDIKSAYINSQHTLSLGVVECRIRRRCGSFLWVETSWNIILDDHGAPSGAVLVSRDIERRKEMERKLLQSAKLETVELLACGVAHDFNNILAVISGNTSLAKLNAPPGTPLRKNLLNIEKAVQQATALSNQLLALKKDEKPVRQPKVLDKLILSRVNLLLSGSAIRCEVNISDKLLPVEIDEGQIIQVLDNLIVNAIQSMPEGGTILIKAENCTSAGGGALSALVPGPYIKISIQDEGVGIPRENQEAIFEPFFTTKPDGSGLGLATSASIINKHKGILTVESEINRGSTFTFHLPAATGRVGEEVRHQDEIITGKGRVLVMDDNVELQETLAGMLARLGYEASFARDGAEALAMYRQSMAGGHHYDVVIMDQTIRGGMGGLEAVQELRLLAPRAKVILSSGYPAGDVERHGFIGFIAKPYRLEELSSELSRICN